MYSWFTGLDPHIKHLWSKENETFHMCTHTFTYQELAPHPLYITDEEGPKSQKGSVRLRGVAERA